MSFLCKIYASRPFNNLIFSYRRFYKTSNLTYLNWLSEKETKLSSHQLEEFKLSIDNYNKKVNSLRKRIDDIKKLYDSTISNLDYEIIDGFAYFLSESDTSDGNQALYRTKLRTQLRRKNSRFIKVLPETPDINEIVRNSQLLIEFNDLKNGKNHSFDDFSILQDTSGYPLSQQNVIVKNIRICGGTNGILSIVYDPFGNEEYKASFFSLKRMKILDVHLYDVGEVYLLPFNKSFLRIFYTTCDETKRCNMLYGGFIGVKNGKIYNSRLIFEENDPGNYISLYKTKCSTMIFIAIVSHKQVSIIFCVKDRFRLYNLRITPSNKAFLECYRGVLYLIQSNDVESVIFNRNFYSLKRHSSGKWNEVIKMNYLTTDIDVFNKCLVIYSLQPPSLPFLSIFNFNNKIHKVYLPISVGTIQPSSNYDIYSNFVKLTLNYPGSSMHCKVNLNDYKVESEGNFSVKSRVLHVPSRDGMCKIPITLVSLNNVKESRKCIVYVYGSYGECLSVENHIEHLPLLYMDYILCFAHIRGGGELGKLMICKICFINVGKSWHDSGSGLNRHNSLYDLIDVMEFLIAKGITNRNRLVLSVSSVSGLIGGNIFNIRPDLCKCILFNLPFLDVLKNFTDKSSKFTQLEYEEFGNPYKEDDELNYEVLDYLYSSNPCNNLKVNRTDIPNLIIYCNTNDLRAPYDSIVKFISLASKNNKNVCLTKISDFGHVGIPSYEYSVETAAEQVSILEDLLK